MEGIVHMKKIVLTILLCGGMMALAACGTQEKASENSEDNDGKEIVGQVEEKKEELTYEYTIESDGSLCVYGVSFDSETLPKRVDIPEEIEGQIVSSVEKTFYGESRGVREVTLPDSIKIVCSDTFKLCDTIEKITISSAETIEKEAIMGCKNLKSIYLGDGVKNLEQDAIYACENLKEIHLSESIEHIDESSCFAGCSSDLVIYAPAGSYAEEWAMQMNYNFQAE